MTLTISNPNQKSTENHPLVNGSVPLWYPPFKVSTSTFSQSQQNNERTKGSTDKKRSMVMTMNKAANLGANHDDFISQNQSQNCAASSCTDESGSAAASGAGSGQGGGSRLARNRATARVRREKKKQEAERLTKELTEQKLQQSELNKRLYSTSLGLSKELVKEIESRINEEEKNAPRGCLFCDLVFDDDQDLVRHYHNEHAAEVKLNKQHFDGNDDVLSLHANLCEKLGEDLALSNNCIEGKGEKNVENEKEDIDVEFDDSSISEEEKRRKRLLKNAESARLCRQRKKLYIQKLRVELPKIKHRNLLLQKELSKYMTHVETLDLSRNATINLSALPQNLSVKVSGKMEGSENKTNADYLSGSVIPRLSGWDHTMKRYKNFSTESKEDGFPSVSIAGSDFERDQDQSWSPKSKSNEAKLRNNKRQKIGQNEEHDSELKVPRLTQMNYSSVPSYIPIPGTTPIGTGQVPFDFAATSFQSYNSLVNLNFNLSNLALINTLMLNNNLVQQMQQNQNMQPMQSLNYGHFQFPNQLQTTQIQNTGTNNNGINDHEAAVALFSLNK